MEMRKRRRKEEVKEEEKVRGCRGIGDYYKAPFSQIHCLKEWLPTGRPTDGRTDRWRDKASYRDAWTHLKNMLTFGGNVLIKSKPISKNYVRYRSAKEFPKI